MLIFIPLRISSMVFVSVSLYTYTILPRFLVRMPPVSAPNIPVLSAKPIFCSIRESFQRSSPHGMPEYNSDRVNNGPPAFFAETMVRYLRPLANAICDFTKEIFSPTICMPFGFPARKGKIGQEISTILAPKDKLEFYGGHKELLLVFSASLTYPLHQRGGKPPRNPQTLLEHLPCHT